MPDKGTNSHPKHKIIDFKICLVETNELKLKNYAP